MAEVHVCPICGGSGRVPPGFYDIMAEEEVEGSPEGCRSCAGRGIIVASERLCICELLAEEREEEATQAEEQQVWGAWVMDGTLFYSR